LVIEYYANPIDPAIIFASDETATAGCSNATRGVASDARAQLHRVRFLLIHVAEGIGNQSPQFIKPIHSANTAPDSQIGLPAFIAMRGVRLCAGVKNAGGRKESDCGADATPSRRACATAPSRVRFLKHCLGDLSITFWTWIFYLFLAQVLVALHSSSDYLPPFKKRKPGRLRR